MKRTALLIPALLLLTSPVIAQDRLVRDFRVARACADDVWKFCSDVVPGDGRIKACMKENMGKLSAGCVDALLTAMAAARETPETKPAPIPENPAERRFNNVRGAKFCEVWLFRNTRKGIAVVYYNTTDLNNAADKMDTCPDSMWDKVTVPSLEAQYDVLAAHKNSNRWWTFDWLELPAGPVETFDGIEARWFGQALLPKGTSLTSTDMSDYSPIKSYRKSEMTFEKGKPVFILDDPGGTPWVMMSFGKEATYDTLKQLGSKLKPPAGWKFRVAVLNKDLTISTPQGYNWIMRDDLQDAYNACKEGTCNFKP